jgi:hypothetical protein
MSDAVITKADIMREVERAKQACPTCHRRWRHDTEKAVLIGQTLDAEERIATLEAQLAEARMPVPTKAPFVMECVNCGQWELRLRFGPDEEACDNMRTMADWLRATLSKIGGGDGNG